jgi:hypothetical protein
MKISKILVSIFIVTQSMQAMISQEAKNAEIDRYKCALEDTTYFVTDLTSYDEFRTKYSAEFCAWQLTRKEQAKIEREQRLKQEQDLDEELALRDFKESMGDRTIYALQQNKDPEHNRKFGAIEELKEILKGSSCNKAFEVACDKHAKALQALEAGNPKDPVVQEAVRTFYRLWNEIRVSYARQLIQEVRGTIKYFGTKESKGLEQRVYNEDGIAIEWKVIERS